MLWQSLRDRIGQALVDVPAGAMQRPFIHIDSSRQMLRIVSAASDCEIEFPVSTSRYGIGQKKDSYQTPRGIHRIAEKIGDNEPLGRVFKGRQATQDICKINDIDAQGDVISTRILWLDGLQDGVNRGGDVDSKERYIYIHGSADEAHIGEPASIGCVRMMNADIVELFDRVRPDDLVVID